MNLDMIKSRNKTEYLILSFTKNFEKLIEQTHRKTQKIEFKLTQTKEAFSFRQSISIEKILDDRVNEFRSIQVYFLHNRRKQPRTLCRYF